MTNARDIIVRPLVTEKTMKCEDANTVVFEVKKGTNKIAIKQAIEEIWKAERKYDPTPMGYEWDDSNPRIQLEPRGERGYIELLPVRKREK